MHAPGSFSLLILCAPKSIQGKCVLKQSPRELIRHGHLRTSVNTGFHEAHFKSPPGQPKKLMRVKVFQTEQKSVGRMTSGLSSPETVIDISWVLWQGKQKPICIH